MAGKAKIVVVEDAEGTRSLLAIVLRNAGHEVVVAPNGELGIRFAETHQPDVVLLDVHLPDLDGFTVARRVLECSPASRVIMLTGDSDEQSKVRAKAAGATMFLVKPVSPKALLAAIDGV